jgi:hypothetical protein
MNHAADGRFKSGAFVTATDRHRDGGARGGVSLLIPSVAARKFLRARALQTRDRA